METDINPGPVFVVCLLTLSADAAALDTRIAAELMHFDYEETDLLGNTLNQETGLIPGLSLSAAQSYRQMTGTLEFSIYDGRVDYDGRTQGGQPHRTTTKQNIIRLLYRLDWSPRSTEGAFYGKAYWQQWDRDIQPNNGVLGLFERYRWWALEAGVQVPFIKRTRHALSLDLGVLATADGTIMIDLTDAGIGGHTLELGNGWGFSARFNYGIKLSRKNGFLFGLQLTNWEFGRSNSKTVSGGGTTLTITEPDSTSRQTIVSAGYRHRF